MIILPMSKETTKVPAKIHQSIIPKETLAIILNDYLKKLNYRRRVEVELRLVILWNCRTTTMEPIEMTNKSNLSLKAFLIEIRYFEFPIYDLHKILLSVSLPRTVLHVLSYYFILFLIDKKSQRRLR